MDVGQLQVFYKRVRPFGLWPLTWKIAHRAEHREDIGLLVVALCWQILTFLLPMGIMLRLWDAVLPAAMLWLLLSFFVMRRPSRSAA